MKKGKYAKRTPFVKTLAVAMVLVTLIGCAIGGTLAWLTAETQQVVNTFTVGNIKIELDETNTDGGEGAPERDTENSYKMIPGWTITKDPVATVLANSEDCYLFVELVEDKGVVTYKNAAGENVTTKWSDFLTYRIADGWTLVDGETNVYYRKVTTNTADQPFDVIKDHTVNVKDTVTEEMMEALGADTYPKLNVTAYAVQLYKNNTEKFEPAEAWAKVAPPASNP